MMQRILFAILLWIPFSMQAQQDLCSGALPLCANSSLNATTAGATASPSDPALACGDMTVTNNVWFYVLGTAAGTVTVTVTGIDNNPGLAMQVYSGSCGSLVPLGPCSSANGPGGSMSINFPTAAGTQYYIMVDGESGNGESFNITATSATSSIVARPDANFLPNPTNGCAPLNVSLTNTTTLYGGTNITYQWRVLPGGSYVNSSGADTTWQFTAPNAYQVELKVCNTECGCKSVLQDVVVQNLVPTIAFSPSNACLNTPIAFSGDATIQPSPPVVNPNVTSWQWNFGDPNSGAGNTASGQFVNHTFVGPGSSFSVRLIVDGICGPDTVTQVVSLHPRPRVSVTPPSLTVCEGSPVVLSATTTNATAPVSYLWSGPPTIVSPTNASTSVTGLLPGGPYVYSIHITDSNNCVADTTANVTIRPKPVVSAGPDDTVCVNTAYVLQGSVSAGIPPLAYTWSPAAGLSSTTVLNPTATISSTRTYCLKAQDTFGCMSDSDCVTLSVYPVPSISANPSYLCASMNPPLQTTLTVNGASAGSSYSWKLSSAFGRITSASVDSSSVTATFPSAAASYSFTVIVIDPATGCHDTVSTTYSVAAGINITSGTNATICQGASAALTASGGTTYLWTANPAYAFADPTQPNQSVSPSVTTTFLVRGTVGSCYDEDTVVITVRPKPVVSAGPDDTVCVNTPYVLQGSVSAGIPPLTYTWNPATGLSGTTVLNPTATISSTRTYCLSARDAFNCTSDTDCVTLSVYPLPTVSASPSTLCASLNPPLQTVFTVNGAGPGSTYRWRLSANYSLITGSNADSSAVTVTFPPGVAASYSFRVIVFNPATSCSDTVNVAFTVTAGLNMTTTNNQTICNGDSTTLTANGATTYLWTANPAYPFANPALATQVVLPSVTTTFIVRGTTGTCYDEDTVVVTVRPKPVVSAGPDDTVCVNTPYVLQGSVSAGIPPLTYTWSPATGLSSAFVLNPTATISSTRTYCLSARDAFGCTSDTDCVTLNVFPVPTVSASPSTLCASMNPPLQTVFTVNGAGPGSTYRWRLSANYSLITGSNADSSSVTVTFPPGVAASYSFRVIVFNPVTSCSDTVNVAFTVTAGLNMTTTANQTICNGYSTTLTANGATTYLWTANPAYPFANPTQATQIVSPPVTTTFIVRGTTGTCYDEDTVVVTVRPKPVADAGPDDTVCYNTPTPLNGSATAGLPPFAYNWVPANGLNNSTLQNPLATITGTTTYCLTVADTFGCSSDTSCVTLEVYPRPQITSPSVICASQAPPFLAVFNVTGAAPGSGYSWMLSPDFALITSAAPDSSTVTATLPTGIAGTYQFTAIVTDAITGCSDTVPAFFTVSAGINMTVSPDTAVCLGTPATLTASGTSIYSWTASPPYAFTDSTLSTQVVTPAVTTTFYVTGTSVTCSDIDTIVVTVNPLPVAVIAPPPPYCTCDTIVLNGSGSSAGYNYQWTSTYGSTVINPTLVNAAAVVCSADTFTLTVTNPATGCQSTARLGTAPRSAPVATATVNPVQICDGVVTPVTLTGTADTGLVYLWTSSPAVTITDSSQLVTSAFPSTQTVFYLTVSDAFGCDTTVSDTVAIYPVPVISASPPFLCTADTVLQSTIAVTGAGAGSTFSWDSIPGCVTPNTASGASQQFDFATCGTGTFPFIITVTDGVTGCVKTLTQTVNVVTGVTLTLTPDQTLCEGDSVALIVSGANTFLWNTGDVSDTIWVGDTLVASATPYVFSVTGTIGSCTGSDSVRVTVNPRPLTPAITGPSSVCENQVALSNYIIAGLPGVGYTWTVTGGSIVSGQGTDTLSVSWGNAGTGAVTLTDTNAFGCPGAPQTLNVTIHPLPVTQPIAGPDTVCQTDLGVYSVPNFPGLTYHWSTINGTFVGPTTGNSVTVRWNSSGLNGVALHVTSADNCDSPEDTLFVLVQPQPAPNFILGNNAVCEGDTAQQYTILSFPGNSYLWSVSGGALVSGQGTDTITVNWGTAGIGLITMIETAQNGCEGDTNYLNVTLNAHPAVSALPDSVTLCNNQALQLTATLNTGSVNWTTTGTGSFDLPGSLTPVYTPGAGDTGYITLTVTASNAPCPDDSDVVVLYISAAPAAAITSSSSGTICYGSTDTLTASGSGSYFWLPDSVATPVLLASPSDTTVYMLIVTTAQGCSDTATYQLNVLPAGIPNGGPDQWICGGDSAVLNGSVQNAGGLQWSSSGDGTFSPGVFSPAVIYYPGPSDSAAGMVDLYITALGACINFTDTVHLTLTPYPVVFAGNDTVLTPGSSLPLYGTVTGGGGIWYTNGTGVFVPTDTVPDAIAYQPSPADIDMDSITIYLESTWSCVIVIDSFIVRFYTFEIPNVFTPYPASPGYNDYFIIRGLPPGSQLKIWDRWGLLVYETDNYQNDWDAAELKSDMYYYILTTTEKEYKGWVKVMR
jgi:gliding motility-associated-like protein